MFNFLTSGDVPTVIITVIAILLVAAYYVFVIPIYEENKKLKKELESRLFEAKEDLEELNKRLKTIDKSTKTFLNMQETHLKPMLANVNSHNKIQEDDIKDLIGNMNVILTMLKSQEEHIRDIIYIVSTVKDVQSNILSIVYSKSSEYPLESRSSHLK